MLLIHASFIYKQSTENAFKSCTLSAYLKIKILLCEYSIYQETQKLGKCVKKKK